MVLTARQRKLRVVFSEGTSPTILRACALLVDEGIASPILVGRDSEVREAIETLRLGLSGVHIVEPARSPRFEGYVDEYFRMRRRRGVMRAAAAQRLRQTDTFAALMLHLGDADMMIAGVSTHYVESLRTILEVIGPARGLRRVSSHYLVLLPKGLLFLADCAVNVDPDPEDLAEIAILTASTARALGTEPRVSDLQSGNLALHLLQYVGGAVPIGPLLMGTRQPAHLPQYGASVEEVVNLEAA
jgi:malate dehydrogenase (oxaloacetate-decarboxylating)(NADP+)